MSVLVYKTLASNKYVIVSSTDKWHHDLKPLMFIGKFSSSDVDRTVKKYMLAYGVYNVYGGRYKNGVSTTEANKLEQELGISKQNCTRCGSNNHNVQSCFETKDIKGRDLNGFWRCDCCDNVFFSYRIFNNHVSSF